MTARRRSLGLSALVVGVAVAFAWPLVIRGIVLSDEGYLLQQALDLLGGRVPYRDMDAFITPGMWFLIAGAFALFGASVIVSRWLMLAAFGVLALTAHRIVAPVAGTAAAVGAVAGLLVFSVWAFPAWTFAFYSPMAVLLALLGLERLLAWQRRRRRRDLFYAGAWIGLAIVFKQNYGAFALVGAALAWAATRWDDAAAGPASARGDGGSSAVGELGAAALGVFAAGAPALLYLLANGAFGAAWDSLVVHPFEFAGRHDIPFAPLADLFRPDLYTDGVEKLTYLSYGFLRAGPIGWLQAVRGTHRMHVLLYWLPLLVFAGGLVLARIGARRRGRRLDAPLFAVLAVSGMLFLGVLPRADFNHLMNVYQPVVIAAAVVLQRTFAALPGDARALRIGLATGLGVIGLAYAGTAAAWYVSLLRTHVIPIDVPRGGVLVDPVDGVKLNDLLRLVDEQSEPGDALLTVPDFVMLNFLAERPVPSAYYNLYEHHIARDGGAAVVAGAEAHEVALVVTRFDNFFSDRVGLVDYAPALTRYLATTFERERIGPDQDYIVYRRRETPAEIVPWTDALADCRGGEATADVRRHLLFPALYHRSRPDAPIADEGETTLCRVTVPETGGVLSLELGYLRPRLVAPGTQLVAEVRVVDGDTSRRIAYETFRVVRDRGARRQQRFRRLDLPLGEWAGREVEIAFHTRLSGRVAAHPLDWKGFAMVYRDARVQAAPGGARP